MTVSTDDSKTIEREASTKHVRGEGIVDCVCIPLAIYLLVWVFCLPSLDSVKTLPFYQSFFTTYAALLPVLGMVLLGLLAWLLVPALRKGVVPEPLRWGRVLILASVVGGILALGLLAPPVFRYAKHIRMELETEQRKSERLRDQQVLINEVREKTSLEVTQIRHKLEELEEARKKAADPAEKDALVKKIQEDQKKLKDLEIAMEQIEKAEKKLSEFKKDHERILGEIQAKAAKDLADKGEIARREAERRADEENRAEKLEKALTEAENKAKQQGTEDQKPDPVAEAFKLGALIGLAYVNPPLAIIVAHAYAIMSGTEYKSKQELGEAIEQSFPGGAIDVLKAKEALDKLAVAVTPADKKKAFEAILSVLEKMKQENPGSTKDYDKVIANAKDHLGATGSDPDKLLRELKEDWDTIVPDKDKATELNLIELYKRHKNDCPSSLVRKTVLDLAEDRGISETVRKKAEKELLEKP